jgi:hypothetical protein
LLSVRRIVVVVAGGAPPLPDLDLSMVVVVAADTPPFSPLDLSMVVVVAGEAPPLPLTADFVVVVAADAPPFSPLEWSMVVDVTDDKHFPESAAPLRLDLLSEPPHPVTSATLNNAPKGTSADRFIPSP